MKRNKLLVINSYVITILLSIILTLLVSGKISIADDAYAANRRASYLIANKTAKSVQNAFREIAKKVTPAVVTIQTFATSLQLVRPDLPDFYRNLFGYKLQQNAPLSIGSGFIIDSRGYIITNYHVIQRSTTILVRLYDGRTHEARIIGFDNGTDLAVLKINAMNLPEIRIGDSDKTQVGDWAVAIGNPSGFTGTFTVGVVSGKNRNEDPTGIFQNYIQTDTAINPGNSGGPLIDLDGKVIGVNSWIHSQSGQSSGISFAVPMNTVVVYLKDIIRHGAIERGGYIGVTVRDARTIRNDLYGGYVVAVEPASPAGKAGIKTGDIITAYNGIPINEVFKYMSLIINARVGETVEITIIRDNKQLKKRVIVGREPIDSAFLNISVVEVNPQHRRELELLANEDGVIINKMSENSPMKKAGFKEGDLIFMMENSLVKNVFQYKVLSLVLSKKAWIFIKAKRKGKIHWAYVLTGAESNGRGEVENPNELFQIPENRQQNSQ